MKTKRKRGPKPQLNDPNWRERQSSRGKKLIGYQIRFFENVRVAKNCWIWKGATSKGYAILGIGGRMEKASRVSWFIHFGAIPEAQLICHRCDNPKCVNPFHLFLGTHKDNTQDAITKQRMLVGEKNGQHKLTSKDVRYIRSSDKSATQLAKRFGVHIPCITRIIKRQRWKHLQ